MLRASIEYSGKEADLGGISEGAQAGDAGIAHGARLTAFADAAVQGDPAELAAARDALRDAAGSAVVVDAAGVVGNFERMVRIADGTGIPLDGIVGVVSTDLREALGIDAFRSRRLARSEAFTRLLGPPLRGALHGALRVAGRRRRRRSKA
ncbi:MAG: hypothetical protein JSU66_07440 [Deltaproteobacteria bacterium]|nr:MAG: hypothetical protein JSU66_07440 [Deltaproteobacteria bacterium]